MVEVLWEPWASNWWQIDAADVSPCVFKIGVVPKPDHLRGRPCQDFPVVHAGDNRAFLTVLVQYLLRSAHLIQEVQSFLIIHHISFSESNDKFLVRVLIDRAKARYLIFLWIYALARRLRFETLYVDCAVVGACDYRVLITYKYPSNLFIMWLKLSLQLATKSIDEVYLSPHRANGNMHPGQARTHS